MSHDLAMHIEPALADEIKADLIYYGIDHESKTWHHLYGFLFSDEMHDGLAKVFKKAATFLCKLHFHPAGYSLTMGKAYSTHQRACWSFTPAIHEDVGGLEHDDNANMMLCGIMFPRLLKYRNERGQKVQ